MSGGTISVFLIDDHPILLSGLESLVHAHPKLELAGSASTLEEARSKIPNLRPRVVVLNLFMDDKETVAVIPEFHQEGVTSVLTLSMSTRISLIDRALQLGARGFIGKREALPRLVDGIIAVAEQKMFLQEGVAEEILSHRFNCDAESGRNSLTPREREVFESLGEGLTVSEIAIRFGVSTKTVETHKENMKRKLGVLSASELRQRAIRCRDL